MEKSELERAVQRLAAFLSESPLTTAIAELERDLIGLDAAGVTAASRSHGVDGQLLDAAVTVRSALGRISDVIHAAAIVLVLPRVLADGEVVANKPSLAAGNDPTRPFDLETDRRVAEFKLSHWAGTDAMRKRHVFKDLVHLAADTSGRQPELFVVGDGPIRFLQGSTSKAAWALDRFPATKVLFAERFGSLEMSVAAFAAGPGSRVRITDISDLVPELRQPH